MWCQVLSLKRREELLLGEHGDNDTLQKISQEHALYLKDLICGYEFGKQFTTLIRHAVTIKTHHRDVKCVRGRADRTGWQLCVFTVIISVLVTHKKNLSKTPVKGCVLTQNNQAYKIVTKR